MFDRKVLLVCLFLFLLAPSCGPGPTGGSSNQSLTQGDFSVTVVPLTSTTYEFTVAANRKFQNAIFSIYGLQEGEARPLDTSRVRLAHIVGATSVGTKIEVVFQPDDIAYSFFIDDTTSGTPQLNLTTLMTQGSLIP